MSVTILESIENTLININNYKKHRREILIDVAQSKLENSLKAIDSGQSAHTELKEEE